MLLQAVPWGAEQQLLQGLLNAAASPGLRKQTPRRCKADTWVGEAYPLRGCLLDRGKEWDPPDKWSFTKVALGRKNCRGSELCLTAGNAI